MQQLAEDDTIPEVLAQIMIVVGKDQTNDLLHPVQDVSADIVMSGSSVELLCAREPALPSVR